MSDAAQRFRQLEALFHRLRDEPRTVREAFLAGSPEAAASLGLAAVTTGAASPSASDGDRSGDSLAVPDAAMRAELRAMLDAYDASAPLVELEVLVDSLRSDVAPALPRGQPHPATFIPGQPTFAQPTAAQPHAGQPAQIGGYRILRPLGEGGMGIVYEAEQRSPRRRVALKLVRTDRLFGGSSEERLRRFAREVEALGRLEHPSIARVYEAGEAPVETPTGVARVQYVAMELVEGVPLVAFANARGLELRSRVELMAQVCDAVAAAHAAGVIHRDLKPANILVTDAGQPKVLDFGIARIFDPERTAPASSAPSSSPAANDATRAARLPGATEWPTLRTGEGELLGTLPYMSPEQFSGRSDAVTVRSDVYALGVVLFELLSGRLPLDIRTLPLADAARVVRERSPTRIGELATQTRGDLDTIVTKTLAKEPERRYADAASLAADLRRWLRHEPIHARPPTAIYQARTFVRRHRTLVAATLAIVAMLLTSSIVLSVFWYSERAQRSAAEQANAALAREAYHATLAAARSAVRSGEYLAASRELAAADPALRGWEWRFLARQLSPVEVELPLFERSSPIRGLHIAADGRRAAAIDEFGHGVVVDLTTRSILWRFAAKPSPEGYQLILDPAGERLVVRGGGEVVVLAVGGGELFRLASDRTLSDFAIAPDGHALVLTDLGGGALYQLSMTDGTPLAAPRDDGVYGHAWWMADGRILAWERSRGLTGAVGAVGAAGGWQRRGRPSGHAGSRDRGILFDDDAVHAVDFTDGTLLGSVEGPFAREDSFALDRTGRVLAIARPGDTTDIQWLTPSPDGRPRESRRVWGRAACFAPNDDLLWTGAADGTLRAWRYATPALWAIRPTLPAVVALAPDATWLASARWGTVRLRSTRDGTQRWSVVAHRAEIFQLAWNAEGTLLATGDERGMVRVLDATNGAIVAEGRLGSRPIAMLSWLHDGRLLATDGTATNPGQRALLTLGAPMDSSTAPIIAADDGLIGPVCRLGEERTAIGTRDGQIAWYIHGTFLSPALLAPPVDDVSSQSSSPSSSPVSTSSERRPLDWMLVDAPRDRILAGAGRSLLRWTLPSLADERPVPATVVGRDLLRSRAAALSADGARVAIGDRSGAIAIVDADRLEPIVSIEVPGLDAAAVGWRADDALVVAGGAVLMAALETAATPVADPAGRARAAEEIALAESLLLRHRTLERALVRVDELEAAGAGKGLRARVIEQGEDPNLLNSEAWKLARRADAGLGEPTADDRERAMTAVAFVTAADRLLPNDHAILNTKALCHVRARQLDEAMEVLDRCDALARANGGRRDPLDVGIRAMAMALRGNAAAAEALAREAEELSNGAVDPDLITFVGEIRNRTRP